MEDSTSIGNDLEMRPGGRNEVLTVNTMDESSKSPLVDLGEDIELYKEQMGRNHATNLETIRKPTRNDVGINVERLSEERRYPTRKH